MATVAENTTEVKVSPEKAAAIRLTILNNYRKIVEKITNLKPVIAKTGPNHPMWAEYRRLKHAATLHIIALRIVKAHPDFVGLKGHKGIGAVTWTTSDGQKHSYNIPVDGVFDYAFGTNPNTPITKLLLEKKAIVGQHLPHGASAASFIKKAWKIVKQAS